VKLAADFCKENSKRPVANLVAQAKRMHRADHSRRLRRRYERRWDERLGKTGRGWICWIRRFFCISTLALLAILLTGCAPMIPVAAATSYVAGQVAMAFAPDSIPNTRTKGSP
jgi:hypothetical protein